MSVFRLIVDQLSIWTVPLIIVLMVAYGAARRVKVYESFIAGGKEGFTIFTTILPYLVAIFVAIGMFRVSGALDYMTELLQPVTNRIGMPPEVLPVAVMRPLSGSGSMGLAAEVIKKAPDSFEAKVASTVFGSTDTTFYVVALYFGSVGIRKIRHGLVTGLLADTTGMLSAVWICHLVFK